MALQFAAVLILLVVILPFAVILGPFLWLKKCWDVAEEYVGRIK